MSDGWAGFMGPRGLPKAIQDKVHAVLVRVVSEPATSESLKKVGAEPVITTGAEFAQRVAADWKSTGEAIRVSGLKVD